MKVRLCALVVMVPLQLCGARPILDTEHNNFSQVAYSPERSGIFLGSPSLARAPDGAILELPRVDVTFAITPVPQSVFEYSNGTATPEMLQFTAAVSDYW